MQAHTFKIFRKTSLVVILSLLLHLSGRSETTARDILLYNATILDGDASVKPYTGSVLLSEGKIKAIYKKPNFRSSEKYKMIDCTGKYICPGLIDAHVHLATFPAKQRNIQRPVTDSTMLQFVRNGILTVRDMAGDASYLKEVIQSVNSGKATGPDIYYAAQFASPHYFKLISKGRETENAGSTPWYKAISSAADVKPAILAAKEAGVTGIKIYDGFDGKLVKTITKEAHAAGLMAWSHATVFPSKPMQQAEAGVNTMSHANDMVFQQLPGDTIQIGKAWSAIYKGMLPDSAVIFPLLKKMKENHIILDPTLFHAKNNKLKSAPIIARWAYNMGIKITTGTDWVYPTGEAIEPLQNEFETISSQLELSNLQVLEASAVTGAAAIGLKDRGKVRKGLKADLLVLDGNALIDIAAFFKPQTVIKNGKVIYTRP